MLTLMSLLPLGMHDTLWMPSFFSDNMVLQRERPIPIWGRAEEGATVQVTLDQASTKVKAGADGTFRANLKPKKAGGPYRLTISDGHETKTIENVMVGEVWIASGQSNMEWPLAAANGYDLAVREANPSVRMFTVTKASVDEPAKDVVGTWEASSPETMGHFSAVGYYFAKELSNRLKVPVGIIHTSWGGTPAESWTSREMLSGSDATRYMVQNYLDRTKDYPAQLKAYQEAVLPWRARAYPQEQDPTKLNEGWAGADYADAGWPTLTAPGNWEETAKLTFDGAMWLRKEIDVPASMAGKALTLNLGAIDDTDFTFFNGEQVGSMQWSTPNVWMQPRSYTVSSRLVRPGRNVIAVRVFDSGGGGGFAGKASEMNLTDGATTIPLSGEWRYKVEAALVPPSEEILKQQPQAPYGPGDPWAPSGLYNAMIAPLIPYAIRGAIWYQGESNAGRAYQYRTLFPNMIQDWRNRWRQGPFPFYFVQLANYTARNDQPVESDWAELREAQFRTLAMPKTGMASAIDIGEAGDIHPRNKLEVGRRLALWALANDYGLKIPYTGPLYRRSVVQGDKIRVWFSNTDGGLGTQDGKAIRGFAIAGEDKKFVWADAVVEGDTVVVSSPLVAKPVAVRYGWSNNPDVNLGNAAGLPASPFRTDDWPGVTVNNR